MLKQGNADCILVWFSPALDLGLRVSASACVPTLRWNSIGTPLELHWNSIGTSLELQCKKMRYLNLTTKTENPPKNCQPLSGKFIPRDITGCPSHL
jgi:hypothetical protein